MKFDGGLAGDLAQGQTTFTMCLKVTRTDGAIMGFTELDQDIDFGGVTYLSSSGFSRFNLESRANLDMTNIKLTGLIDAVITRDDLILRKYDYANVEVFLVNYLALGGKMTVMTGRFGTVTVNEYTFDVELRGLSHQTIGIGGELCSPTCRVDLGSPRCGIAVGSFSQTGSVGSTDGFKTMGVGGIAVGSQPTDPSFDGGLLTWLTGANAGLSTEIASLTQSGALTLHLDAIGEISPGDTFSVTPACDKTLDTCKNVYSNVVNFQGEPYVPDDDHMLDYPDYKSPHS